MAVPMYRLNDGVEIEGRFSSRVLPYVAEESDESVRCEIKKSSGRKGRRREFLRDQPIRHIDALPIQSLRSPVFNIAFLFL